MEISPNHNLVNQSVNQSHLPFYIDNQFDSNLQVQLDVLKEKLNLKEKEIAEILAAQREEYEKNLKLRDDEVSLYLDDVMKENLDLKKTNVLLELENSNLKQQLSEKNSEYTDNKVFYENLRIIKDKHELKNRELIEKYEKENKNLIKDNKKIISNFKKIAYETKNKIFNEAENDHNFGNGYVPLETVEENFLMYENKLRIISEEINNKEKYIIVLEQKYEMVLEENKMIKRKLQEEKEIFIKKIEECQKEELTKNNMLLAKLNSEVLDKKHSLDNEIKYSIEKSERLIEELVKEKNRIKLEFKLNEELLNSAKFQIENLKKENDEIQTNFESALEQLKQIDELKTQNQNESARFKIEKDAWEIKLTDMTRRLNDLFMRISELEIERNSLKESLNFEIEKIELKNKNLIEILNNEILGLNSQIKELKSKLEDERQNGKILLKMKKEISDLQIQNETYENELSKKETNGKIMLNNLNDLKSQLEKLNNKFLSTDEESNEKSLEIKNLKEKLAELEIESYTLKKEYGRILNVKDELYKDYEDSKKNNINLNNQLETMKISFQIENHRLKNQIAEDKERLNKLDVLQDENSEVNIKLKKTNQNILNLYKSLLARISQFTKIEGVETDESGIMISEIEKGFDVLIVAVSEKISKQFNSVDLKLMNKYEDEIKELKKKLNTVIQITSSLNKPNNSPKDSNFKLVEKENVDSLYESIYTYLKNLNLKHLLQIFGLNIQKEEEMKTLINDKNLSKDMKKQISDLSQNFLTLKKLCEGYLLEYQQRAKMYIQPEELEKKMEEFKLLTQSLLDMVLDYLMNFKTEFTDAVVFKMSISEYNSFIENISINLENLNKKVNLQIENYNRTSLSADKALDALIKTSTVDFDLLNSIMNDRII